MKPLKTIGTSGSWTLRQRGDEFLVQVDGRMLMTSRRHGSEEALAAIGLARLTVSNPSVLVGGLGFGFTLRAALDALGREAKVTVCELSPAMVEWNRTVVGHLSGHALDDPRVELVPGDILKALNKRRGAFDAVLLDVDNGPYPVTREANAQLYGLVGLATMRGALRARGRLAVWSAGPQGGFLRQLREAGFEPSVEKPGDGKHLIFVGDAP